MPSKWLISADSHVMEPPNLWAKALTEKHGDAVPREIGEWKGEQGRFYFTGIEAFKLGELVEGEGELPGKTLQSH